MKPGGNIDKTFVIHGYLNWKDASGDKGCLANHKCSSVHKRTVEVVEIFPKTTCDIGEQLCSSHAEENLQNLSCFLKIFQTVQFYPGKVNSCVEIKMTKNSKLF